MKASELIKQSLTAKQIYEEIINRTQDQKGVFKIFFPHWVYIAPHVIQELIQNGFKISISDWDGVMIDATIIEW